MQVSLKQKDNVEDIEVHVWYSKMNDIVSHIDAVLNAMNCSIIARRENEMVSLSASEIFYVESIDKRTYLYGKKEVYESNLKLSQMEQILKEAGFIRIRKNCILNKYKLKSIKILPNSRIEATLGNDEKLIVTRKYITDIRKALEQK